MSEGAAPKPEDPIKTLARQIYISLAAQSYAGSSDLNGKPEPKALGKISFQLASAFYAADSEINAEAIALEKSRNTFTAADLDLGSIKQASKPA